MVFGPITSWQIGGEAVKTVSDFILGGSKISADGDCSYEIKRHLVLGRKAMTFWSFNGPELVVKSWQWKSERRKEANIPWVMQLASVLQGISQKEREREKGRHGDQSSDGAKVF